MDEDQAANEQSQTENLISRNFRRTPVIVSPEWTGSRILVFREPENILFSMPRMKTAWQLLEKLGLQEETALVARGRELLTPDRHIWPDDEILVRSVGSRG